MTKDNDKPKVHYRRGKPLLIFNGFPTDHPHRSAGRLPHADTASLVAKALAGINSGKYKNANDAATKLCREYEVIGNSDEARHYKLRKAIRAAQKAAMNIPSE